MDSFTALQQSAEALENQMLLELETKRARTRTTIAQATGQSRVRALDGTQPEEILKAIEALPNVRTITNTSGSTLVGRDLLTNATLTCAELIERALLSRADLKDGRSTHLQNTHTTSQLIQSRADLSQQEKSQYIKQYGIEAWEALPPTRPTKLPATDPFEMGKAEYLRMSTEKRAAFIGKLTQDYGMKKAGEIQGAILHRP